jgi:hypothetical protein
MFARVYTAPPPEVLYDMYENDLSFDEAAKNLYDREMEQYDDTDMMDELLGAEDPMSILGNDDVEKAIYQKDHPGTSLTPYGPALSKEAFESIRRDRPGIEAIDWNDLQDEDYISYAENLLDDPRINLMVEAGTKKAEDEGFLDNLGDIFNSFGSQLGNIGGNIVDSLTGILKPEDVYAAYNEQILQGAESITKNVDAGMIIDAPSLGETLRGSAVGSPSFDPSGLFGGDPGTTAGDATEGLMNQMFEEFERMISGQGTTQSFLQDVHLAFKAHPDQNLFANAMTEWMFNKDWEDKIEGFGADSETLFGELSSVFSQGIGDYTGADTSKWSGKRPIATPKPAGEIGLTLEEEQARRRQNRIDVILDNARRAGITMTEEQAATTVDKWGPGPLTTQDMIKKMQEEGVYDANAIAKLAPIGSDWEAVETSEMRKRHTRTLSKAFYEYVFSQPWGGRSEFSSLYPTMLSETKTLFLLDNYIKGLDGLTEKYGQSQRLGSSVKPSKLGDAYKVFLDEYMQNPKKYQAGAYLADRIKEINTILEKDFEYPSRRLDSAGGNWTQDELDAWKWVYPLFGADTRDASINRYNLMVMIGSQGEQGTRKDIAKFGITSNINHYTKQGYTGAEIFAMQTKRYGESKGVVQQVIHPPRPTAGEQPEYPGEGPDYGDLEAQRQQEQQQRDKEQDIIDSILSSGGTTEGDGMAMASPTAGAPTMPDVMTDTLLQQIMQQNAEAKAQQAYRTRGTTLTPRQAMINNRISQGESMQEAMDWANASRFPVQPTSFTTPGAFEQSFGASGQAATLSQPGAMGGTLTGLTKAQIDSILGEKGTPYDISSLPYKGQTLTQEEIDEMLGAYDYPM